MATEEGTVGWLNEKRHYPGKTAQDQIKKLRTSPVAESKKPLSHTVTKALNGYQAVIRNWL